MWVDIANLMGPKGADGADGQKGEPGPVNIGLNPDEPIGWDQTGGFTFNFVDGSEQTVNLPIASAQSAGLQSPTSAYDSGWRDITSLFSGISSLKKAEIRRVADRLIYVVENIVVPGNGIVLVWGSLPTGFRPRNSRDITIRETSTEARLTVNTGGGMVLNGASAGKPYSGIFTLDAPGQLPTILPGSTG